VTGDVPQQVFSRKEVCRQLAITERQLRSWEKQELIQAATDYGFFDLLALRTIAKLRKDRISTAKIRSALVAMRDKLEGVENPLVELRVFSEGRKIRVQVGEQQMEPVSGQLLLNFEVDEIRKLVSFPGGSGEREAERKRELQRAQADALFQEALELEQCGATSDAVDAYRAVLELDPAFAGAYVNLGTIFFTGRDLEEAEKNYRQAIEADPQYALARFNLGNLYDELGNRPAALKEYEAALKLNPTYADVHYNIALLFQSTGQVLKAVSHWKQYLKLDPGSPWASIARRELDRIYRETVVENTRSQG
jgi:Tfp pilus assembly protein PilF